MPPHHPVEVTPVKKTAASWVMTSAANYIDDGLFLIVVIDATAGFATQIAGADQFPQKR